MIEEILNYILNHIFEIITAIIAIYWAILSTFNYYQNKKWMKLHFNYSVLDRWFFWFKRNNKKMILSITNIWNQIENINMIWFYINNKQAKFLSFIDDIVYGKILLLPKNIKPSERIIIQFKKKKFIEFCEKNNVKPKYIWISDSAWKIYKIKFNYNKIKD